jgi:rubredoxin
MKTEFVNRAGETIVLDVSEHDPCPECCGGLEPIGDAPKPRGYRCRSCGLVFTPAEE